MEKNIPKRELAAIFLRLGLTSFGGPVAHIAMMEEEFVRRKRWVTPEKFLDLVAAANLIPGPSSSELAIYIGQMLAGVPGLLIAGLCFIFPASLLAVTLAWVYVRFGSLPEFSRILYGIKPVMIAIILHAILSLGRTAFRNRILFGIGVFAFVMNTLGVGILITLLSSGLLSLLFRFPRNKVGKVGVLALISFAPVSTAAEISEKIAPTLNQIFFFFLKVGSIQFGSGYVLLAFLKEDLVNRWHWLSSVELLDAITVGQITPGPVFTTATFIGYILAGFSGAAIATIAIFLPAFVLVSVSGRLIPKIRSSRVASAFIDGVVVASLGLMASVSLMLFRVAIVDRITIGIFVFALTTLVYFRVNSFWLILAGAGMGFFLTTA